MAAVDSPLVGWGTPSHDDYLEPLNKHSNAYAASLVVKAGPGRLYGFTVYSSRASAQFVQVFDLADVPSTGAIPALVIPINATADRELAWIPPRSFYVGCVIANSSTGPTYTAGSADCFFDAQYL
jgi:hypothetical protein